jgi:hypothetical protein
MWVMSSFIFLGLGEKDVKPASTIDEDLVELGAHDHRLQFGEASPLIRA